MFDFVKKRAGEPSTWAGLAAVLEGLKVIAPQYAAMLVGLQAIFGGVAILARESGG